MKPRLARAPASSPLSPSSRPDAQHLFVQLLRAELVPGLQRQITQAAEHLGIDARIDVDLARLLEQLASAGVAGAVFEERGGVRKGLDQRLCVSDRPGEDERLVVPALRRLAVAGTPAQHAHARRERHFVDLVPRRLRDLERRFHVHSRGVELALRLKDTAERVARIELERGVAHRDRLVDGALQQLARLDGFSEHGQDVAQPGLGDGAQRLVVQLFAQRENVSIRVPAASELPQVVVKLRRPTEVDRPIELASARDEDMPAPPEERRARLHPLEAVELRHGARSDVDVQPVGGVGIDVVQRLEPDHEVRRCALRAVLRRAARSTRRRRRRSPQERTPSASTCRTSTSCSSESIATVSGPSRSGSTTKVRA